MKELSYFEFCEDFYPKLSGTGKGFLYAEWEITYKCNFDCLHCYLPREYRNSIKKELSLKEIETVMDKLVKLGVLWIVFSGGEPFMREDFLLILEKAQKKGFLVGISTNGSLITDRVIEKFKKYFPLIIDIPIYGATPETHDKFTQIPGSWEKVVENILKLKQLGNYPVVLLKSIINIYNNNEIEKMKILAKKLNVPFRYNAYIYASIDGNLAPCKLRISPEEIVEIEKRDPAVEQFLKSKFYKKELRYRDGRYVACGVGKNFFVIDPYGYIRPCVQMAGPKYFILGKEKLNCLWEDLSQDVEKYWRHTNSKCGDCSLSSLCANCPARSYAEVKKFSYPVDFFCKLAYKRYVKIIKEMEDEKEEAVSKTNSAEN
ncbi:MAG: radical SAM protein [Candidatus Omnitrophica bacterium]|nr:radical SAM protein [Candidatus Omnitrophota bacterium]